MKKLENKIALITGGNSGIGLATAKVFANHGASVIITGRNEQSLQRAVADIGEGTLAIKADVTNLEDIDALFLRIKEVYGSIDILFANAGVASFFPTEFADEKSYDDLMKPNVKGVFFSIQKSLSLLNTGGSIIINSSSAWLKGLPNVTVYAATKAAVRSFARGFAAELLERQIRVNVVSPGAINTPIFDRTGGVPKEAVPQLKENFTSLIPMKRFARLKKSQILYSSLPLMTRPISPELIFRLMEDLPRFNILHQKKNKIHLVIIFKIIYKS